MRNRLLLILLINVLIFTFGCSTPSKVSVDNVNWGNKEKLVLGISLLTLRHQFYLDLKEGIEKTAKDVQVEVNIKDSMMDLNKQVSDLEEFILDGVDAIIVSPCDSKGLNATINKAKSANIPVITLDITADGADVDAFVASDNIMGGRLAAEYMVKILGKKGKIAIIGHSVITSAIDRVKGFKEYIGKYPDIEIVAELDAGGLRDKAVVATEELLQAHLDLKGIFAINDDSALGALSAVEDAGRSDKIFIVGFDATPEAQERIKQDTALKADIIQFPKEIGRIGIETALKVIKGQKVEKNTMVRVGILDKRGVKK